MITLYQIGPGGYWTGFAQDVPDDQVIPSGWTARPVPADRPAGQHAVLTLEGWQFTPVAPPVYKAPETPARPELVITQIVADAEHAAGTSVPSLAEVTCPVGTTLTFTAELRIAGQVVPLSDSFRMPIRSRDGRERVLLADMANGILTILVPLRESGAWSVTESIVNESLPAEKQMSFAGVKVFAVEG